ncbi:hypothetical protein G7Y79_00051g086870 [Physcia stellaris]|nr:hypothetical protein G7Y79_00051g086870 [Physcia stellaris]
MGATDATILPADGTPNGQRNNHCSHACSIVLLCTVVPFCVLSILFLIVYASCGHKYLARKRKEKHQQKELKGLELRKMSDADSLLSRHTGYSRGEDGLALGWAPVRDLEGGLGMAPPPPPITKDRPGDARVAAAVKAASRR